MSELITRLTDDDPEARLAALLEAGELRDLVGRAAVVEAVVRRLWDDHPGIRQAALDMLGRLAAFAGYRADDRVVGRALELLEDERPKVRAEAAAALALLGPERPRPERLPALFDALLDPEPEVRREALAALGDLGDGAAADPVAGRLEDPDPEARFEAAFALASLSDPRGLDVLRAALGRAKRRLDACEALRRLGDPAPVPDLRRLADKWLLPWADRLTVWATLFALGETDAGAKVVARVTSRRVEERTYALSLIGSHRIPEGRAALERVAASPRDLLQDTAVRALGELADPGSVPALERIAADPATDPEVQADARRSLERCRGAT